MEAKSPMQDHLNRIQLSTSSARNQAAILSCGLSKSWYNALYRWGRLVPRRSSALSSHLNDLQNPGWAPSIGKLQELHRRLGKGDPPSAAESLVPYLQWRSSTRSERCEWESIAVAGERKPQRRRPRRWVGLAGRWKSRAKKQTARRHREGRVRGGWGLHWRALTSASASKIAG
ncbi:hypothetical protein CRG98_015818 [Punica granatum]|uniref:Uncharacterized protein n=1 Tax=Punica granatum TaxID=22663 RepID=A0A2I0K5M9_PUNGR|nr:hypothetical protein CRG98_015818 [Punica granatum]